MTSIEEHAMKEKKEREGRGRGEGERGTASVSQMSTVRVGN